MSYLIAGEYDVTLNGVQIHYTVQGSGPVMIAHSGGPGMDARFWDDFAKIDNFVTIVMIHPRGSGLSGPAAGEAYLLPEYAADVARGRPGARRSLPSEATTRSRVACSIAF